MQPLVNPQEMFSDIELARNVTKDIAVASFNQIAPEDNRHAGLYFKRKKNSIPVRLNATIYEYTSNNFIEDNITCSQAQEDTKLSHFLHR